MYKGRRAEIHPQKLIRHLPFIRNGFQILFPSHYPAVINLIFLATQQPNMISDAHSFNPSGPWMLSWIKLVNNVLAITQLAENNCVVRTADLGAAAHQLGISMGALCTILQNTLAKLSREFCPAPGVPHNTGQTAMNVHGAPQCILVLP